MAEKPPEEGYISVVDEEPEIFELLKWDNSHTQKQDPPPVDAAAAALAATKAYRKSMIEDVDPFDYSDPGFMDNYRMTKDMVRNLCEELKPVMPESTKSVEFSIEAKVLSALAFYATGKYQKSIGGKTDPNISQYFVSVAVNQVTEAMNHPNIVKKYIHFPHLRSERDATKTKFYMKYGIPNVIGAIDCTHVPISRPGEDHKIHFNKSYHSKKVQIICDSDLNITSVYSTPGGSYSHDAILHRHGVRVDLVSLNQSGEECWLIGGPYYTQMPYVMTPIPKISKKSPQSPEKNYSVMHSQTHAAVTDTIKHLKSRWKVLQASCNKQFNPPSVAMVVVACCVLHNICNKNNLPVICMTQTEERLEAMKQKVANGPVPRKQMESEEGIRTRARLVERIWNEKQLAPDSTGPKKRAKKDKVVETQHQPRQQIETHHQQNHLLHTHVQVQSHPQSQPMSLQPTHQLIQQTHHEDLSKRPRLMTFNNPTYSINIQPAPVWTPHYPQH